jgi:hypothetical protein
LNKKFVYDKNTMLKENDHIGTPVKPYMAVFFSANLLNLSFSLPKNRRFY